MNTTDATERLWGGRFKSGPSLALENLSRSDPSFFRLAPYDLAGSRAHANELQRAGILTATELQQLLDAMQQIEKEFVAGELAPILADEDVHTFLERELTQRLKAIGGKLRAGRSRNDQAANDLRLYLRDKARKLALAVIDLQHALVEQAAAHVETVTAGFTHLRMRSPFIAMSTGWWTGIAAARVRRWALPRVRDRRSACEPICPQRNSATTVRVRTPSTPSPRAIMLPSSRSSRACWRSTCRGSRKK